VARPPVLREGAPSRCRASARSSRLPKLSSGAAVVGRVLDRLREHLELAGEAGSLLKAERQLERLVEAEHETWRKQRQPGTTDYLSPELRQPKQGAFEDVTDEEFWRGLGTTVERLFREYAQEAAGAEAAHRRLFARDGIQVLRFLETLRSRYDVVLMNPPFGDPSLPPKAYIDAHYPRTRNDVYAAFVERWLERLVERWRLGAITSRTDLGCGVLDTAMVETAAYVPEKTPVAQTTA
jgi:hypothetical protein